MEGIWGLIFVEQEEGSRPAELPPGEVTFLSLNRYERKKNVALAIRALAAAGTNARLVVAGGWDSRLERTLNQ